MHLVTHSNNKAKNNNLKNTKKLSNKIILRCTPCLANNVDQNPAACVKADHALSTLKAVLVMNKITILLIQDLEQLNCCEYKQY